MILLPIRHLSLVASDCCFSRLSDHSGRRSGLESRMQAGKYLDERRAGLVCVRQVRQLSHGAALRSGTTCTPQTRRRQEAVRAGNKVTCSNQAARSELEETGHEGVRLVLRCQRRIEEAILGHGSSLQRNHSRLRRPLPRQVLCQARRRNRPFANLWQTQVQAGDTRGRGSGLDFNEAPWGKYRGAYIGAALAVIAIGTGRRVTTLLEPTKITMPESSCSEAI